MKKSSKILALLLMAAMVLTVFAGCSNNASTATTAQVSEAVGGQEPTSAGTDAQTPTQQNTPEATEPVSSSSGLPLTDTLTEVTLWATINPQAAQSAPDGLGETATFKELERLTNIKLKATSVPGNMAGEVFPIMIASGDYTDLLGSLFQLYSAGLDAAVDEAITIDALPYIEEYCPNYYSLISQNEDTMRMLMTDKGRMVAFAMLADSSVIDAGPIIRKDWLDQVGMDIPTTYDELHDVLTAFKVELGASDPMWINYMGTWNRNAFTDGYGVPGTIDPMQSYYPYRVMDGKVDFAFASDDFKEYLTMVNQWYSEGLLWSDFNSEGAIGDIMQSNSYQLVLNGNMGYFFGEMSDITIIPAQAGDDTMELVGIPDMVKNKGDVLHNAIGDASVEIKWAISTSCAQDKIPLICKYIDYCYTEEGSDLGSWGIEGESYVKDASGNKSFTDLVVNNPDGLSLKVCLTLYTMDDNPFYIQSARTKALYTDEAIAASEAWISNRDGAYFYPLSATMTAADSEKYSTLWGDISTYATENIPKFMNGELSLEKDWDSYVATLKSMNLDEMVGYKQAAYDRYEQR